MNKMVANGKPTVLENMFRQINTMYQFKDWLKFINGISYNMAHYG